MLKKIVHPLGLVVAIVLAATDLNAQGQPAGGRGRRAPGGTNYFNTTFPAHGDDFLLCRPEDHQATLSVLTAAECEGYVAYQTEGEQPRQKPPRLFSKETPVAVPLVELRADAQYRYRFWSRPPGTTNAFTASVEYHFHTARPPGAGFTFTLTADAHLDEHTAPEVYLQTLANIRADAPDFHIDLGNLFMTDKHPNRDSAARQYRAERYYLSRIGTTIPVLLALGTHDGESAKDNDGGVDSLSAWAYRERTRYFPNPLPDNFYSGDQQPGQLQDYYAWRWGDALFVVLDPFRYSSRQRGGGDGWAWTLGQTQYDWLNDVLQKYPARFKFVFIHNLLSGDQAARGGIEVAGFNEWGGKNRDGTAGFLPHRPGWEMPVHELLRRWGVAVVFKAHDNFFARQELDGITYQMVPQPSFAGDDRIRDLQNYGYRQGDFRGNSGHVRVRVSPAQCSVDYIRTPWPAPPGEPGTHGAVAFHYAVPAANTR